jgi:ABC-type Fe3+-hydroxamate transport system substrate-binding protein
VSAPRVVSLVPSATETLLAWDIRPVAVTRFCEQPELVAVGGTKDPDLDAVVALSPDLVVMCVEENRRDDANALERAGIELFVFDIDHVDDVEPQLAALADRLGVAWSPAATVRGEAVHTEGTVSRRAFVPIWRRPWMTLSTTTYGSSVLEHIGIGNAFEDAVFADRPTRYPEIALDDAVAAGADLVVAPSEPYPFAERHRAELETVAPVVFVDGKDLFWWGVRTPGALGRLARAVGLS